MFATGDNAIEEEFFDMLVLMQGSRIDDQRSGKAGTRLDSSIIDWQFISSVLMADEDAYAKANKIAQLDEDMDFFSMLAAAKKA